MQAQLLQQEVQHQESAPSAPSWDSTSHTLVQLTLQLLGQLRQASHTTRRLRLSTDAHAGELLSNELLEQGPRQTLWPLLLSSPRKAPDIHLHAGTCLA